MVESTVVTILAVHVKVELPGEIGEIGGKLRWQRKLLAANRMYF